MITHSFRTHSSGESEAHDELEPNETFQFDFESIMAATDNFSDTNKLGEGGFGAVYKVR